MRPAPLLSPPLRLAIVLTVGLISILTYAVALASPDSPSVNAIDEIPNVEQLFGPGLDNDEGVNTTYCPGLPPKPTLLSPAANAVLTTQFVTLDWRNVACARRYTVVLRLGSTTGPIIDSNNNVPGSIFYPRKLGRGRDYYWRVGACNRFGCNNSWYRRFIIAAAPTPTKPPAGTPGPGQTPQPGAPKLIQAGGTVDANRMRANSNCGSPPCNGVFINIDPGALYFFPCDEGTRYVQMGGTIYFIVHGFPPNTSVNVSYLILAVQNARYFTTINTDANGNLQMTINDTNATQGHYHWMFNGGGASYCGHYD